MECKTKRDIREIFENKLKDQNDRKCATGNNLRIFSQTKLVYR